MGADAPVTGAALSAGTAGAALDAVRQENPLVHNLTNFVAMDLSANVLLAVGASPAMVHAREEAAEFAALASAVVVNIGTLAPSWAESMGEAASVAADRGIPWILDPVAAGATSFRTEVASELVDRHPTVVRGNASEILALTGGPGRGRGVDSVDSSDAAVDAAVELARRTGGVVAVTGEIDVVTDGTRAARVEGGDPLMPRVTAMGCAASALVGAFSAATDDPFEATVSALAVLGVAGARAGISAPGPGTFRWRLLDELYALDADTVVAEARLS